MIEGKLSFKSEAIIQAVRNARTKAVAVTTFFIERGSRATRIIAVGGAENGAGLPGGFLVAGKVSRKFTTIQQQSNAPTDGMLILLAVMPIAIAAGIVTKIL
jgi:hypothetical protein